MSNRFPRPQPQVQISPAQSEEEEEFERTISLEDTEDDLSITLQTSETESSSAWQLHGFPPVTAIKVPTFESKMRPQLRPVPLSVTPARSSVLSLRSVSSR